MTREADSRVVEGCMSERDALARVIMEADRTADSPTVSTIWDHVAGAVLAAGYRKGRGDSTRKVIMAEHWEDCCCLTTGHERDCCCTKDKQ